MGASSFTKNRFKPPLRKAGLSSSPFIDLRHTFGSLLLDADVPLTYASEQMGHASTVITAQILNPQFAEEFRVREPPRHATIRNQRHIRRPAGNGISSEVIDSNGGPTRIRTWNQQIMSLLL
jgi:integrase